MKRRSPKRRWLGVVLFILLVVVSACAENAPMDSLDPAGPIARQIDGLFWLTFWIAAAIFVVVEGAIVVATVFFRDRPGREEPKQTHGSPRLEVAWTIIPAVILAVIAVPTLTTLFDLTDSSGAEMEVEVIGHQWWFEFVYPEAGVSTANVLVIPEGTEVALSMTSHDVLHNLWFPQLAGKRYLAPGVETELLIEADEPGEYWGQCGEFCGLSHSLMRARVQVLTASDYAAWLADQQQPAATPPEGSVAERGQETFLQAGCTQCHVIAGVNDQAGQPAPDLTHFSSRNVMAGAIMDNTPENISRWLANPPAIKPGSFMPNLNLTNDQIEALVAYLEWLK